MATVRSEPLLSICIPTFNRAALLEVCLATVLPQAAEFAGEVECVVSDNCSSDHTPAVVASASAQYALRSYRNASNIGGIANFTRCASELARGEYVWLIGDDDALCSGAVERILKILRQADAPDMVALNVCYLPPERRPSPDVARQGIACTADKRLRSSTLEGIVPFEDLFEGPCADLTACYASIVRRSLWKKHFPATCFDPPFTSVRTTYPHTWIIAQEMPGRPCGLIATPSVMIYELPASEYSWSKYRALCALVYATELLQMFEQHGVPRGKLRPYYLYQLSDRAGELGEFLWNRDSVGGLRAAGRFAWLMRRYPLRVLRAFLISGLHPQAPRWLSAAARAWLRLRQSGRYLSRKT
jgi:glycosyltransferase involved in cell wall biosynthesis